MRLGNARRSTNVRDVRGRRVAVGGGVGVVGTLAILAVSYFTGIDLTPLLGMQGGTQQVATGQARELTREERASGDFVTAVLGTTEDVWSGIFPEQVGRPYTEPTLVLFSRVTRSACGSASAATGPFYCPADQQVYLDTDFFNTLRNRLGAKGDFAAAYVIAHEIGHHVQNLVGTLPKVDQLRRSSNTRRANALTVRLELQADCYAGIWARQVQGILDPGDIDEAMNAARQIGDDKLQRAAGRVPRPETFTHGTSEQRSRWFQNGYRSGRMRDCDTFADAPL